MKKVKISDLWNYFVNIWAFLPKCVHLWACHIKDPRNNPIIALFPASDNINKNTHRRKTIPWSLEKACIDLLLKMLIYAV